MSDAPLHGTAIAYQGMGCLMLGASGTGKSRLAQDAMMLGAKLVADDRVTLMIVSGMLAVAPAPEIANMLEIRGFGIIRVNDALARQVLHLVVTLDPQAEDRLPEPASMELLGVSIPTLTVPPLPKTSAAALLLYLRAMQQRNVMPTDWRPPMLPT